jgi:hypothetical protein
MSLLCQSVPSPARPKLVRCVGAQPASLLQQPAFPAGGTVGLGPLVRLDGWQGTVDDCPSGRALVWGRAFARIFDRAGGEIPPVFMDAEGPIGTVGTWTGVAHQFGAVPVKLRIRRCKVPTDFALIDCDSRLVVDAGDSIAVDVMAPTGWALLPPNAQSNVPAGPALYVEVQFTVCPLDCYSPPEGRLTWYHTAPVDGQMLVRPPRARSWQSWHPTPAGVVYQAFLGDPAMGAAAIGTQQINGGFVNTDMRAGAPMYQLQFGGGAGAMSWVWAIE